MTRSSALVVAAGMPRSGSTWLFNVLRCVLQQHCPPHTLTCGWHADLDLVTRTAYTLVKAHNVDDVPLAEATHVFYSYRDVRDSVASAVRRFKISDPLLFARGTIAQDELWRSSADYVLRYEGLHTAAPHSHQAQEDKGLEHRRQETIGEVADVLGFVVDPREIDRLVEEGVRQALAPANAKLEYDSTTLMHSGHITDGRHGSWMDTLSASDIASINQEFAPWIHRFGYAKAR